MPYAAELIKNMRVRIYETAYLVGTRARPGEQRGKAPILAIFAITFTKLLNRVNDTELDFPAVL